MMFKEWSSRPVEIKTLFNPMFCSVVLNTALFSYMKEAESGMPIPLSFLVLPMVLHAKTRNILPKVKSSNLGLWCRENENELLFLSDRVRSLNKMTLMSMSLLKINEYVRIVEETIETERNIKGMSAYIKLTPEMNEIYMKSQLLGRWFANSGETSIIYTYLGIRP